MACRCTTGCQQSVARIGNHLLRGRDRCAMAGYRVGMVTTSSLRIEGALQTPAGADISMLPLGTSILPSRYSESSRAAAGNISNLWLIGIN